MKTFVGVCKLVMGSGDEFEGTAFSSQPSYACEFAISAAYELLIESEYFDSYNVRRIEVTAEISP